LHFFRLGLVEEQKLLNILKCHKELPRHSSKSTWIKRHRLLSFKQVVFTLSRVDLSYLDATASIEIMLGFSCLCTKRPNNYRAAHKHSIYSYRENRRRLVGDKTGIIPPEIGTPKISERQKFLKILKPACLIQIIIWLNSCNASLFAGMTPTLHKSQVRCSGVIQWWTCSSLISGALPAEAGCPSW